MLPPPGTASYNQSMLEPNLKRLQKMSEKNSVVLVTASGPDAPGITSELTRILADSNATILDIGQAVIHGQLTLSILFESAKPDLHEKATIKEILFRATELGLKLDFKVIQPGSLQRHPLTAKTFRYALTLISEEVTARALHRVTSVLSKYKTNIDVIERLSEMEFGCVQLLVSSTEQLNPEDVRKELLSVAQQEGVDIAVQRDGLFRRSKRLIVMDMDSTLIEQEVIDEFAREVGRYEEVRQITERAMKGQLDFDQSLIQRCAFLRGLTHDQINKVIDRIKLTPGADHLVQILKRLGYKVALISGGFTKVAERLQANLGLDYIHANRLEFDGDVATGKVIPPIINAQRKADLLELIAQQEKITLDQVIAIGDGANDLLMLEKAGLGIAFNAKPIVSAKADLALNQKNLTSILYLLGIPGREVAELLKN